MSDLADSMKNFPLSKSLKENLAVFQEIFHGDESFVIRHLNNKCGNVDMKFCVLYFEGMTKPSSINIIVRSIVQADFSGIKKKNLITHTISGILPSGHMLTKARSGDVLIKLLQGCTVVLADGVRQALIIPPIGGTRRQVGRSWGPLAIEGPRDGFTESLDNNLMLIRRRIKTPHFKARFKLLGKKSRTRICLCYLDDVVNKTILTEFEKRLETIDMDGVMDSNYIAEQVRDAPLSPFPTVASSEKPDVVAARLLEGRIALIVNGSPFVLTVPYIIAEIGQANKDYYSNFIYASANRLMRNIAVFGAILAAPFYLSIVNYHQEILPTPIYLSIAQARHEVALPTAPSLFLALFLFDLIREVGTRLPSQMGNTISFVGSLILGEVLIVSRIVSAPVVIVAALSGLLLILNPNLSGATILVRTFLLLEAAFFGIYGTLVALFIVVIHLLGLRSFGVPYLMGLTRVKDHNYQDAWIRAPWWLMTLRPKIIGARNLFRQATGMDKRTR